MAVDFKIREVRESDRPFIYDSWSHGFKNTTVIGPINQHVYQNYIPDIIEDLIESSTFLIAADKEEDNVILGYLAYEPLPLNPPKVMFPNCVHWIYTRQEFQKEGIATELFHNLPGYQLGCYYSSCTPMMKNILLHTDFLSKPIYNWMLLFGLPSERKGQ